jgi:hypothetical protein
VIKAKLMDECDQLPFGLVAVFKNCFQLCGLWTKRTWNPTFSTWRSMRLVCVVSPSRELASGNANMHEPAAEENGMHIDGQCHCGHITFEAEVDPEKTSLCHCTDCQTLSGALPRVSPGSSCGRQWQQARADLLPALRFRHLRNRIWRPDRDPEHKGRDDPTAERTRPKAAGLGAFAPALDNRLVRHTRTRLGHGADDVQLPAAEQSWTSAATPVPDPAIEDPQDCA